MQDTSGPDSDLGEQLVDMSQLTVDDFEPLLDSTFAVNLDYLGLAVDGSLLRRNDVYPKGQEFCLQLVEVKRLKSQVPNATRQPYSLLFRGTETIPLFCDVHLLVHESLGNLTLFLTPINAVTGEPGEDGAGHRLYESVIN